MFRLLSDLAHPIRGGGAANKLAQQKLNAKKPPVPAGGGLVGQLTVLAIVDLIMWGVPGMSGWALVMGILWAVLVWVGVWDHRRKKAAAAARWAYAQASTEAFIAGLKAKRDAEAAAAPPAE